MHRVGSHTLNFFRNIIIMHVRSLVTQIFKVAIFTNIYIYLQDMCVFSRFHKRDESRIVFQKKS